MTDRERLLQILNVPIHPHLDVDPLEAVTDYLLDNDVVPVVRCKKCKYRIFDEVTKEWFCNSWHSGFVYVKPNDFCSYGEGKDPDD